MNIDLVYYFREVNHFYYLNGPEKVNGNIVNNSPAYQLSSSNDVVTKINQMIASLAPDITNVVLVSSELYTGDIQVNTYSGELNVSSAPDYTNILTSINNNLTNLNNKFSTSMVYGGSVAEILYKITCQLSADISSPRQAQNTSFLKTLSDNFHNSHMYGGSLADIIFKICCQLSSDVSSNATAQNSSFLNRINVSLNQSVSPNLNITDVISSLNSNIHNDLTNINTTENNKDTVLIIDGQQEFKLHKDDE